MKLDSKFFDTRRPGFATLEPAHTLRGVFAIQELILFTYTFLVGCLLIWSGASVRSHAFVLNLGTAGTLLFGVLVARVLPGIPQRIRTITYRIVLTAALLESYLSLRTILPVVRPDSVDAFLAQLDVRLFGVVPALFFDKWNSPHLVEYFAFFYYGYFLLLFVYMTAAVWLSPSTRRTAEFAIGTVTVYALGHLGYMLVPGYGPVGYLAHEFRAPLQGGFFWGLVENAVAAGGAQKDIFPSLHTAVPLWFAFFAWNQGKADKRWRLFSWLTALVASNIVVSTVFLRWHYGIDVIAGLALAIFAARVAPRIALREEAWRTRNGFPEAWVFPEQPVALARPVHARIEQ